MDDQKIRAILDKLATIGARSLGSANQKTMDRIFGQGAQNDRRLLVFMVTVVDPVSGVVSNTHSNVLDVVRQMVGAGHPMANRLIAAIETEANIRMDGEDKREVLEFVAQLRQVMQSTN